MDTMMEAYGAYCRPETVHGGIADENHRAAHRLRQERIRTQALCRIADALERIADCMEGNGQ